MLSRVLQNILLNVVVHGESYMFARVAKGEIIIGNKTKHIKEIDVEHLFERFYTADASRTSQNTGLGLAIAKELITQMDGQITAEVSDDLLIFRIQLST